MTRWLGRLRLLRVTRRPLLSGRDSDYDGRTMSVPDPLLAPIPGAQSRTLGGVQVDVGPAGAGRVKRIIYPVGFRWSSDMKSVVGTEFCMHAHVGFLARGHVQIRYADGCTKDFIAPQVVA